MSHVWITEARPHYCGQILRRLRTEHAQAFALVGLHAHRELRKTFDSSCIRRAAFLDGELAALWGVTGSVLSPFGFVWLVLTNAATQRPMTVLRETRRQIDDIMRTKVQLVTTVLEGDEAALRLCSWLGFHVGHNGLGAPAVSKWGRRTQMEYIRNTPEIRLPAGNSHAIALGYHGEA